MQTKKAALLYCCCMVYLKKHPLFFLIGAKGLFLVLLALFFPLALAPDEAQYWTWSKALDLGYFSKPAGIGYQIACTTFLFGDTVLGVRIGAMVWGACTTYLIYYQAIKLNFSQKHAFWAAALFALSPIGFYLSFAATTDGPAIFWMLVALVAMLGIIEGKNREVPLGLAIATAVFFKWSAFLFWPLYLIALFFVQELRNKRILLAFLLSLLGFVPSLIWNVSHEFATFLHVKGNLFSSVGKKSGNFFDFFGAQIALFSPIPFFFLFFIRKFTNKEKAMILPFLCCFFFLVLLAIWKKMQPNWALFSLVPLFILAAKNISYAKKPERIILSSLLFSVSTILASLTIFYLQDRGVVPISFRYNAFRQNAGNEKLKKLLQEAGYTSDMFLFSDKYQNASLLSFYGPEKKRAYYFPLSKTRKNQFSFWPQMQEEEIGASGYFLVLENQRQENLGWIEMHYKELLTPYFSQVSLQKIEPLFSSKNEGVRFALLFYCDHYLGGAPKQEESY